MTGTSLGGMLIIVAVVVAGLVIWLGLVFWAGKRPYFKHSTPDERPGDVRGGRFVGEGRSVMPRRDAPPDPDRGHAGASGEVFRDDDRASGVPSAPHDQGGAG
jgi:hypothetical protein